MYSSAHTPRQPSEAHGEMYVRIRVSIADSNMEDMEQALWSDASR